MSLHAVAGHQVPAEEAHAVQQEEMKFEQAAWLFKIFTPLLYLFGAWVQVKKRWYRLIGGKDCNPRTNLWLFDGVSLNGRRIKDGAAFWPALDVVYNFKKGEGPTWFHRAMDRLWVGYMRNAQAVRNRLKIVEWQLAAAIMKVAEHEPTEPVRILSIASGSGQDVIEVVGRMRRAGIKCEVLLLDIDKTALTHATTLAWLHHIADLVTIRECNAASFYHNLNGFKPKIVMMCGLIDYLRDTMAVKLITKVHRYLAPGGFFLCCHIHPNPEKYFMAQGINWDMLYRTAGDLQDLLAGGGFLATKLFPEPLGIHTVAVAQKV